MPRREESGLSLAELIVAIALLGVGVIALAAISVSLATHAERADARTQVRLHAQAQMERLLATPPGRLTSGASVERGTELSWEVDGGGPWTIRLVARRRRGRVAHSDTLVTVVSLP